MPEGKLSVAEEALAMAEEALKRVKALEPKDDEAQEKCSQAAPPKR